VALFALMASDTSAPGVPLPESDLSDYFISLCNFLEGPSLDSTPNTPKPSLPSSPPVSPKAILPQPALPAPEAPSSVVSVATSAASVPPAVLAEAALSDSAGEPSTMVDEANDASTFVFLDFSFYPKHVLIPPGYQAVIQHAGPRFLYLFHGADLVATLTADESVTLSSPPTGKFTARKDSMVLKSGLHSFSDELFFYFNPKLQPSR